MQSAQIPVAPHAEARIRKCHGFLISKPIHGGIFLANRTLRIPEFRENVYLDDEKARANTDLADAENQLVGTVSG